MPTWRSRKADLECWKWRLYRVRWLISMSKLYQKRPK